MLQLREATIDDLALLQRWDEMPQVLAADPHDDWGWETELLRRPDWRRQLIAELDGRPIGFMEIADPARADDGYWAAWLAAHPAHAATPSRAVDIWIGEADALGQGHGTRMLQQALALSFAEADVGAILLDPLRSNARARALYARLGFVDVGPWRFGEDDCQVMRLPRGRFSPPA